MVKPMMTNKSICRAFTTDGERDWFTGFLTPEAFAGASNADLGTILEVLEATGEYHHGDKILRTPKAAGFAAMGE